jgi:methionine-rich copper-binding protein CopC
MSLNKLDTRQIEYRAVLQQLFPYVANETLDVLLSSINAETTPPLKVDATNPASRTVNVGPTVVANPQSGRNHTIPYAGSSLPSLISGTFTFPSASGGNITTSTGGTYPLTLPSGQFVIVLLSLDPLANLIATIGTPASSIGTLVAPAPPGGDISFAYVILQNVGGTIQNVNQNAIFQMATGGSSSAGGGTAQEVSLTNGSQSVSVTFPLAQPNTTYGLIVQLVNTTDVNPQFQTILVNSKSTTGFTAEWNFPLSSGNYKLDYFLVPPSLATAQIGEFVPTVGTTSATIGFPDAGITSYVVIAELMNFSDVNPQFQPLTVTSKATNQFVVKWNKPLDSGNYRISWQLASYQS